MRRQLFCARDRFGVKPFYYQFDGRDFAFASEPKALVLTQARPHRAATRRDPRPAGARLGGSRGAHVLRRTLAAAGRPLADASARAASRCTAGGRSIPDAARERNARGLERGIRRVCSPTRCACACAPTSRWARASRADSTRARWSPRPLALLDAAAACVQLSPTTRARRTTSARYVRAAVEASGATSHVVVPDGADFWSVFDRLRGAAGRADRRARACTRSGR